MSDDDRSSVADTLSVVVDNIEALGNVAEDPIGAMQGLTNILGSIAANFGPKGQLASMGFGFVSSLLGLFGEGTQPKPLEQVIREQIDDALNKYHDRRLREKSRGLIQAFQASKAYLDGAAATGRPLDVAAVTIASTRVPLTQGSEFMGELGTVIDDLFERNTAKITERRHLYERNSVDDAIKCIKYCELYAKLATIRDAIFTQMISMSSHTPELEHDLNGLIGFRDVTRSGAQVLFERLYTIDYGNNILPYFDPDNSPITDSYATSVLGLGKYDRSRGGYYCISTRWRNQMMDMDWQRSDEALLVGGKKSYITLIRHSQKHCYWKLVPHGEDTFSIINKERCNENYDYCNTMLSFDGQTTADAHLTIERTHPVLWQLLGRIEWTKYSIYS